MTQFAKEVQNSDALAHLRRCAELLTELESVTWNSPEQRDLVSRIRFVVEDVHRRLTTADLDLVPRDLPSILEHHTQSLLEFVQLLKDSGPEGDFDIAFGHQQVDSVLEHAPSLQLISLPDESLQKAAEQFTRTAIQVKEDIAAAVDVAKRQFQDLSHQITDKGDEFDSVSAGHKTSFDDRSAVLEAKIQELTGRVNQATERIEREVTSIQETFRQSQGGRDEEFQQTQSTRDEEFHSKLDNTVAEVETFRDQARSMLEEVAGASSAEHYAKQRDAQRKNANIWRWIGIASIGGLIAAAVWVYSDSTSAGPDFSFNWLAGRTGLFGALVLLVTYALRQSGQHRRREEQIERVANELMLLWPFVNRLPDEDRLAVLLHVAPLYFKGGLPTGIEADTAIGVERIRNAIAQVIEKRANP